MFDHDQTGDPGDADSTLFERQRGNQLWEISRPNHSSKGAFALSQCPENRPVEQGNYDACTRLRIVALTGF